MFLRTSAEVSITVSRRGGELNSVLVLGLTMLKLEMTRPRSGVFGVEVEGDFDGLGPMVL